MIITMFSFTTTTRMQPAAAPDAFEQDLMNEPLLGDDDNLMDEDSEKLPPLEPLDSSESSYDDDFALDDPFTTTSEQQEESSTERPKKRRKVQFATTASVYRQTEEPPSETWYTDKDYFEFERDRRETIKAIQYAYASRTRLDPTEYCAQGLQISRRQMMQSKLRTMQCQRAVLEQQMKLKSLGQKDPHTLEAVSKVFSESSSQRAFRRAAELAGTKPQQF